jgi:hypothetical protein
MWDDKKAMRDIRVGKNGTKITIQPGLNPVSLAVVLMRINLFAWV